jgi:hypothetical protein
MAAFSLENEASIVFDPTNTSKKMPVSNADWH